MIMARHTPGGCATRTLCCQMTSPLFLVCPAVPPAHYLIISGPSNELPALDNHKLSIVQQAIHTALNLPSGTYPYTSITVWPVAQPVLLKSQLGPMANSSAILIGFVLSQLGLPQNAVASQLEDPSVLITMASSLSQLGFVDPASTGPMAVSFTDNPMLVQGILRGTVEEAVLLQKQHHASIIGR